MSATEADPTPPSTREPVTKSANPLHEPTIMVVDGRDGFTPDMLRHRKPVFEVYWGNWQERDGVLTVWTIEDPGLCEVGDVVILHDDEHDPDTPDRYGKCMYVTHMHYTFEVL